MRGHTFPGRPFTHIKYEGRFQKKILLKQAKDRGARDREAALWFSTCSAKAAAVTGAVGVDTREDKIYVFEAKASCLARANAPACTPGLRRDGCSTIRTATCRAVTGAPWPCGPGRNCRTWRCPRAHRTQVFHQIRPGHLGRGGSGLVRQTGRHLCDKPDRRYGEMLSEVNKLPPSSTPKPAKVPCTWIVPAFKKKT